MSITNMEWYGWVCLWLTLACTIGWIDNRIHYEREPRPQAPDGSVGILLATLWTILLVNMTP